MTTPDILVLAPPQSRRLRAFQNSLQAYNLAPARVVNYHDYLAGKVTLAQEIRDNTIFRIESTGEDCVLEKEILRLGQAQVDDEGSYMTLSSSELAALQLDKGELIPSRQWFLGYRALLQRMQQDIAEVSPHQLMSHPRHIVTMFDKVATHQKLNDSGVNVPRGLTRIHSFDELAQAMEEAGMRRVFVKVAHGSSASGVVALETNGRAWQATTTVRSRKENGKTHYYNVKKLQKYRDTAEIVPMIDYLCKQRVHVEQWLPKASLDGSVFDIRVVVIAGSAQHILLRRGKGAITNLHLGNQRGNPDDVQAIIPPEQWQALLSTCEQAAQSFDDNLYVGVDVMITSNFRSHAVLEMNAFGDYHRGIYVNSLDTYGAQLQALGINVVGA